MDTSLDASENLWYFVLVVESACILRLALALVAPAQPVSIPIFDDGATALRAVRLATSLEPPVPLSINGVSVDDPATTGPDFFHAVEGYVRVPQRSPFPLSFVDIFASGYVRPLVFEWDGTPSAIGTSVVVGPSFRPEGAPLDLVPQMLLGRVTAQPGEEPQVLSTGSYGGAALFTGTRRYVAPRLGSTSVEVSWTWRAIRPIVLDPAQRGNDAFRLITLSSMLADAGLGLYDARYVRVLQSTGQAQTTEIDDALRGRHLFQAPQPLGIGGKVTLFKDRRATWNAGGPTVGVRLLSVSGANVSLGVQGYLAETTDPNDDSLSVWIEWVNPPAVIAPGTQISVTLRISATPATDLGDLNHDGACTRSDALGLLGRLGQRLGHPEFDAYADLDADRVITCADYDLLVDRMALHPADLNADGVPDASDLFQFLDWFEARSANADLNADGVNDLSDFFVFLDLFQGCR